MIHLAWMTAVLLAPALACAQDNSHASPDTAAQHDARMAWWHEAKFGLFIHWGLYAIPARGEWVMNKEKIPAAEYELSQAYLLADRKELKFSQSQDRVVLDLTAAAPDKLATVICLEIADAVTRESVTGGR